MPRGRKPRKWVKIDCDGILRGSVNYLFLDDNSADRQSIEIRALASQAIWVKLIAYSEICGGRPGFIEDNNNKGLPIPYLAQELHCPFDLLKSVLDIMASDGAIKFNGTGSIELVNFEKYQFTEYDRQRPYRQAKKEKEIEESDPDKYLKGKYGHMVRR